MAPTAPYRPLKIAPRSRELSSTSDSGHTSSASPMPSTIAHNSGSRSRGSQTVVACMACRKRKSKCSRERPRCSTCWSKRTDCVYETEEGQTRLEHLRSINYSLRNQVDDMAVIVHFLQSGSYEEAIEVLHRLRSSTMIHETASSIRDSQLILPYDGNRNIYDDNGKPNFGSFNHMEGITKEGSADSMNSSGSNGSSTLASRANSMTDSSVLHPGTLFNKLQHSPPPAPPTITLPGIASLTATQDRTLPGIHHSPSPQQSQQVLLPPIGISVDEVR